MYKTGTLFGLIKNTWSLLSRMRKKQLTYLLTLMVICSFAEVFSIGSLIPFLSVVANPEKAYTSFQKLYFFSYFDISSPKELIFLLVIIFSFFSILSGALRLFLTWYQTSTSFGVCSDLSLLVFNNTLHRSYEEHVSSNSSEILAGVSKSNSMVYSIIIPFFTIISSIFLLTAIFFSIIYVNPKMTLYIFGIIGIIYFTIVYLSKKFLLTTSIILSQNSVTLNKIVQGSLGGIRDIIISSSHDFFINKFDQTNRKIQKAGSISQVLALTPRLGIESIGIVIIAVYVYFTFSQSNQVSDLIPVLGVLVFGIQKMLPIAQVIYSSLVSLKGNKNNLQDVITLIGDNKNYINSLSQYQKIDFKSSIQFSNVHFSYQNSNRKVFNGINFKILKGAKIGLIGSTGCGKSSLVDLISCLLTPTKGNLIIDDVTLDSYSKMKAWQSLISVVPQNIFILNASIIENIAFGIDKSEINYDLVEEAAKKASLHEVINTFPNKYQEIIGENGLNLSGGQRQRLSIARAFYNKSKVLILDEGTSALDNDTEFKIMNTIYNLGSDLTVIIVAHRLSTLNHCDFVFEIKDGQIIRELSKEEFLIYQAETLENNKYKL
jgi:ABC-type multidrug transport system fused ATPase/permease subunit